MGVECFLIQTMKVYTLAKDECNITIIIVRGGAMMIDIEARHADTERNIT